MWFRKCVVKGCDRNSQSHPDISFYSFPKVKEINRELIERRRNIWVERTNTTEKDLMSDSSLKICARHFILGYPCYDGEKSNLDWAPTLYLEKEYVSESVVKRFIRSKNPTPRGTGEYQKIQGRGRKKARISEEVEQLQEPVELEDQLETALEEANEEASKYEQVISKLESLEVHNQELIERNLQLETALKDANDKASKYELKIAKLDSLEEENSLLKLEIAAKSKDLYAICLENVESMEYYTRFTPAAFEAIFLSLLPVKENNRCALDLRRQFFLTLLKLTHNFGFRDLAYRFGISRYTASRYFLKWVSIVHDRLFSRIVFKPNKETLLKTMPMCFRNSDFGDTTEIWDCFEIQTETPHIPTDQASSFSNYKQRHTVKVLLSVTPQGTVDFVSNGFCGRVSDKEVVIQSGILELVNNSDLILADRGFPLEETLAARGARYRVPAFMKDRKQLPGNEAEVTKRIANVRIHVERVIGAARARFRILKGPISIKFLSAIDEMHSLVDKIVKVCCVLNNLLPSVVPSD